MAPCFFYVKSDQAEYWSSNYSSKKMPMAAEMAMYKTGCFLKRQSAYHIMTARRMHFQSKKDRIFGAGPPTVKRKEEGKAKRPNPQSPKRPARKLLPGSATKCDRLQTSPNKGIPARVRRTFRSAPQPLP